MLARLLGATDAVARLGLAALLAVVAWTVISRAAYGLTGGAAELMLPGSIELASHALMITIMAALPRAAVGGLVRVEIFAARLPARLGRALERVWAAGFGLFAAIVAMLLADEGRLQWNRGDATQDLALPLGAVTGWAAVAAALVAVAALLHALARGRRDMHP
ncbi:TRAP transporter small permease subunit [Limibaculum sp. M0105]|uniref:TRAP transporter small permease protein n=1 Tax=Thermohalobaculum xanthum TaxID=2753746 RepID=A0A8J7MA13_9RHOB|nr:TRAP transporter small permease subunit [Thermohalobaculum xanthum]MBK0401114.1 TRAP transporter small permease subunit [Thermohalobaculum xanthum]